MGFRSGCVGVRSGCVGVRPWCGCEIRVCGCEIRVCGCEIRVCGCEIRVCGCEIRVCGTEIRVCGSEARRAEVKRYFPLGPLAWFRRDHLCLCQGQGGAKQFMIPITSSVSPLISRRPLLPSPPTPSPLLLNSAPSLFISSPDCCQEASSGFRPSTLVPHM